MDRTIVSLALLKAQWELNQHDYLDTFAPFVVECLRLSEYMAVSLPQLKRDMEKRFGLTIPQNALKLILNRLKSQGYIKAENKAYVPVYSRLEKSTFAFVHQKILTSHERVIKSLIEFCESEYQVKLNQSDAESALHTFLQADCFLATGRLIVNAEAPRERAGQGREFMVAAFIQQVEATRSADFEHVETIVKGSMLASALYLPDPSRIDHKFKGTELFFDTSFLIYALGHAGPIRQDPCLELLSLLSTSGAKLSCFSHTFDEVWAALNACVIRLEKGDIKGGHGPSLEYFLSEGIDADDVLLRIGHLEEDLQKLHIQIRPSLQGDYEHQIDEVNLKAALVRELGYVNDNAADRDVKSLAAVTRIWKGRRPLFLQEAPALLVTTNSALVRVARLFFGDVISTAEGEAPHGIGPCITDQTLTTLLWLKQPTKAPDLPRKRIIADCMAAMQPTAHLWAKYEAALEGLMKKGSLPPDDYYLMRYSREAKRALMDETLGDEDVFIEGTVVQVMERARKSMLEEANADLEKERAARAAAEGRLMEERAKRVADSAALQAMLQERRTQSRMLIVNRARRYAYCLTLGAHVTALAVVLIGTYSLSQLAGPGFQLSGIKNATLKNALLCVQVAVFILGVLNLQYGTSVHGPLKRLEAYLGLRLEKWLIAKQPQAEE